MTPELRSQIAADVLSDVAEAHRCTVEDIQSRRHHVTAAKREATVRLRALAFSYPEIGAAMNCSHAAALMRLKA